MTTLAQLVATSRRVSERGGRLEKIDALSSYLKGLAPAETATAVSLLAGELPRGRIGVGWATLETALPEASAPEPSLTLDEVASTFEQIAATAGAGSVKRRVELVRRLLERSTAEEQRFLTRVLMGELRQGALEGVMLDAVGRAAAVPLSELRRAAMLAGDLKPVARAVLVEGAAGLKQFRVELFRPLRPMLAQPAEVLDDAFARHPELALEYKVDGARVQVHRRDGEVRVFTRNLKDITHAVPELVEMALVLEAEELILDGEAVALRADGSPQPFQTTMRRFGRKLDTERLRRSLPLAGYFFDCLHLQGETLIDAPAAERWERLDRLLPEAARIPHLVTRDPAAAAAFLRQALAAGHEGLMAKSLDAPYEAGGRGYNWLKVKPAHTVELVVLAVEWGSGRRRGWLSNLHLGARREGTPGDFVMLGKTFKGLTDKMLAWQTERLLELEVSRDRHVVNVRPELVVEIAFSDVQASPRYPGGLALRFARVKGYRTDKGPHEADTFETVQALYEQTHGR